MIAQMIKDMLLDLKAVVELQHVPIKRRNSSRPKVVAHLLIPRGFASGDAGRGALVDGEVWDRDTNEASMLFPMQ